jgi:hypothetical protein
VPSASPAWTPQLRKGFDDVASNLVRRGRRMLAAVSSYLLAGAFRHDAHRGNHHARKERQLIGSCPDPSNTNEREERQC